MDDTTIVIGKRTFARSEVAYVLTLPKCQYCIAAGYSPVRLAAYDFAGYGGSWGYGCTQHYREYRKHNKLGTGKGQKLVLRNG